jgi:hypothetical protein
MTINVSESLLHWNYFLALESDLEHVARYIEFSKKNFGTYSIELAHLLLASASEVDVVAKELCKLPDPTKTPDNITAYREIITKHLPELKKEKVYISRFGISFVPWKNWSKDLNPFWWNSYNKVKHQRNDRFQEANLKNVLNSMGGLLIIVFYFYKLKFAQSDPKTFQYKNEVIRKLQPEPNFMRLSENYYPSYRILENNY